MLGILPVQILVQTLHALLMAVHKIITRIGWIVTGKVALVSFTNSQYRLNFRPDGETDCFGISVGQRL